MNIEVFARCLYVNPETSHNRLAVFKDTDGDIFIEYVLFDPSGSERNAFRQKFPVEMLKPNRLYALVEFWDSYLIIEHRAGTYEGVFGAHSMNHKATFAVTQDTFFVLTNSPVSEAPNVRFNAGHDLLFDAIQKEFPAFTLFNVEAKTKAEIAARFDANAAVAALEAQVDLLTDLVLTLASGTDADKLRAVMNETGLVALKGKEDLLVTVRKHKASLRAAQAERAVKILEAKQKSYESKMARVDATEVTQEQIAAFVAAHAMTPAITTARSKVTQYKDVLNAI